MAKPSQIDLVVIGSGPAGLAAAVRAKEMGIRDLVVFERDERPGGILQQCIHTGFGLEEFEEDLTGPEYANRYARKAQALGVDISLKTTVLEMDGDRVLTTANERGLRKYNCKAIILAMGCRERPRGAVGIAGTRPAGVFTAGQAQRLINVDGYMPGKRVVILGSGDIGMIMARRLTLEGAEVRAVVEILHYPGGLMRNVVQCLHDFDIPLLLGHTVSEIHGERRVTAVTLARVDSGGEPVKESERTIECDTLLLSVGLIPENELSRMAGVPIDERTGGPFVNDHFETGVSGIFSCGNVVHVNDLVDNVSAEGQTAAMGVSHYLLGTLPSEKKRIHLDGDERIAQIVPQVLSGQKETVLFIRVKRPMGKLTMKLGDVFEKKYAYARPGEMIRMKVPRSAFLGLDPSTESLKLRCEER